MVARASRVRAPRKDLACQDEKTRTRWASCIMGRTSACAPSASCLCAFTASASTRNVGSFSGATAWWPIAGRATHDADESERNGCDQSHCHQQERRIRRCRAAFLRMVSQRCWTADGERFPRDMRTTCGGCALRASGNAERARRGCTHTRRSVASA